jgi:hypothetical protein
MNSQTNYTFISDSGHGWVRVPRHEIKELGISDKVSRFSYVDAYWVYLEEDCDFTVWMLAHKDKFGMEPNIVEKYENGECFIRNLNSFQV